MFEKKRKNPWDAVKDLDALAASGNASVKRSSEKFRAELAARDLKFGRIGERTCEQQAAWDTFVAELNVTHREIRTQEDLDDFIAERYLACVMSGRLSRFGEYL